MFNYKSNIKATLQYNKMSNPADAIIIFETTDAFKNHIWIYPTRRMEIGIGNGDMKLLHREFEHPEELVDWLVCYTQKWNWELEMAFYNIVKGEDIVNQFLDPLDGGDVAEIHRYMDEEEFNKIQARFSRKEPVQLEKNPSYKSSNGF